MSKSEIKQFFDILREHESILLLIDPENGNILDASNRALEFYGYDHTEFTHMNVSEINEMTMEEVLEKAKLAQNNVSNFFELTHILKSGEIRKISTTSSPLNFSNRKVLLSIIKDITQQSKIETTLDSTIKQFEYAKSLARLGVWILELQNSKLSWSDQIYEIFEIDPNDFSPSYDKFLDVIHPDDRDKVNQAYQNSLETKLPYDITHRLLMPDGRIKYVQERCHTEFNQKGEPVLSIGTVYEVTQIHKLSEKIMHEKEHYEELMRVASDGVHILDQEGNVIDCSNSFASLLGYTREEALKLNVRDWDASLPKDQLTAIIQDLLQHPRTFETIHKKKDNSTFAAQINAKGITLSGTPYLYASTRDISEQKKIEAELVQAKRTAEKANQAKSEFLANMSHEIRTPLNGVVGIANLLNSTSLSNEQQDYLNKLRYSSKALLHVINDILDYSKIEAGKLDINPSSFDLNEFIKHITSIFKVSMKSKKLTFELSIDSNVPMTLYGDTLRITQILNNLFSNAIKFTQKGFIKLSVEKAYPESNDKLIKFSVQDSGIGMSQNVLNKIFRPFEQGDSSTTKHYGGTGLGLMISKNLVELMGGEIFVESKEQQGSTFSFDLPLMQKELVPETPSSPTKSISNDKLTLKQTKTALLVEDNQINQIVTKKFLEQIGFKILIANNGLEAINKVKAQEFDVIFMDLHMPVMDGLESSTEIRKFNNDTPIIAISAAVMKEDIDNANQAGINQHLAKPIQKKDLIHVLTDYFEFKKA